MRRTESCPLKVWIKETVENIPVELVTPSVTRWLISPWRLTVSNKLYRGHPLFKMTSVLFQEFTGRELSILYHLFSGEKCTFCFPDGPENVQIKGPAEIQFGQTLTLSCSAESRPAASYNWTLNGTLVEGQNSSILTKAINNPEDSGTYTCHAVNFVTDRSSAATHQVSITGKLLLIICHLKCRG